MGYNLSVFGVLLFSFLIFFFSEWFFFLTFGILCEMYDIENEQNIKIGDRNNQIFKYVTNHSIGCWMLYICRNERGKERNGKNGVFLFNWNSKWYKGCWSIGQKAFLPKKKNTKLIAVINNFILMIDQTKRSIYWLLGCVGVLSRCRMTF